MICKISLIILIVFSFFFITISSHKIYFISLDRLNWDAAFSNCKAKGMNLVSIKTREEMEYLKQFLKETYGGVSPLWLGAYRENGQYVWFATGEKIKNFFWHAGEPNDKSGNENCIHTWETDFDWNDNDCELELGFICDLEV
ncbi:C-type lectin 37Db-like [Calliphora vicina]|uniref:C-type lectin 37Db-like n=1 Tax=Calliphora vicina TaxID=7373 RepID=UPI00325A45DA